MRLKLYRARTLAEALARVRAELGPEALILANRRVGDGVEVTAARDESDIAPPADPAPRSAPDVARDAAAGPIARRLVEHALPSALMAALLRAGAEADAPDAVGRVLAFEALADDAALLFAGPPGAGKTVSVARLAARLALAGRPPLVVTTDTARAGAAEQLAAYTRLLGIDLIVAATGAGLARAVARRPPGAALLVDTAGADPRAPDNAALLRALAAACDARPIAVIAAGTDAAEAAEIAAALRDVGARQLVATRLDAARRLGAVCAAAHAGLALAELGVSPAAPDGLIPATPDVLADRLLGRHAPVRPPHPEPVA